MEQILFHTFYSQMIFIFQKKKPGVGNFPQEKQEKQKKGNGKNSSVFLLGKLGNNTNSAVHKPLLSFCTLCRGSANWGTP